MKNGFVAIDGTMNCAPLATAVCPDPWSDSHKDIPLSLSTFFVPVWELYA